MIILVIFLNAKTYKNKLQQRGTCFQKIAGIYVDFGAKKPDDINSFVKKTSARIAYTSYVKIKKCEKYMSKLTHKKNNTE